MSTLLLRFGAPLQSWGSSSVYDQRDTDDMPTKSAVIGLVAAALGRKRGEPLDDLNSLKFGVRIDHPGTRLNDFQITDMGEKMKKNVSNRVYLSDALFLVGLSSSDDELLNRIDYAINHPVYPLFLGRRSCPPTTPLNLGIRKEELYEALYQAPWLLPAWRQKISFRYRSEVSLRIIVDADEDHGAIKKDVPVSFSPYKRQYSFRYLWERESRVFRREDILIETEHDPMKEL